MKALALFAILCGVLLALGDGEGLDKMGLKAIVEPRLITVIVSLKDADERYRWLSVYGCSAEVHEHGASCSGFFERESSFELSGGRKQHLVYWRGLPGGTMQITAMAFDADQRVLAQSTKTIFRGQ